MLAGIRSVAVLGALLFGVIWVAVAISPERLERSAVGFVKQQITQEMQARTAGLVDGNVGQGLAALSDRLGLKQDSVAEQIQSDLPELVGEIVSRMCGCDGPTKSEVAAAVRDRMKARIAALGAAQSRVVDLIEGRYEAIVGALRLDVMIFVGTNTLAFLGVLAVTLIPAPRKAYVIYPAVLLVVAVIGASTIYLFNTNWFYAILFQDYWGYGYSAIMLVIFGFLLDIAINRARVTLRLVEALPNALVPIC